MKSILIIFSIISISSAKPHALLYSSYYDYVFPSTPIYQNNYAEHYAEFAPVTQYQYQDNYIQTPVMSSFNILAETTFDIKSDFSVIPLTVVAQEHINVVQNGEIMGVSDKKPMVTVKSQDKMVQCTPAVKITLQQPLQVYSLQSSIVFPSEVIIRHADLAIPVTIGTVIAPIPQSNFVSLKSPAEVYVLYAIPTSPFHVRYISNLDALINENQGVVVESDTDIAHLPPKNVTILQFPEKQAEPILAVDEEDEELVNRNPPIVLAPAGIVQSTQPEAIVSPFSNSKESPILIALREEAYRHRLRL